MSATAPDPPPDPADVLADWDVGVDAPVASGRSDRGPFPVDAVAVLSGAAAGAVLSLRSRSSSFGVALVSGCLWGAAIAAGARRVWRLEP